MDGLKQEVSWLEKFPPDIWAYIAYYLSGEQLGRLLMTGETYLRQRLRSPTVVKSINLGRDFAVFKSLPRFLNDFPSLEELSIYSCRDQWSFDLGLTIDSIPSGVKKLELKGCWGKSPPKAFGEPGTLNLAQYLPRLETLNISHLYIVDYSWMARSPQTLTSLSLQYCNGTVELPSSLIHFETKHLAISKSSFVGKLPSSLESFVVTEVGRGFELVLPLIPPSCRRLSIGDRVECSDGPISQQSLFEQLPKSLTWFTVPRTPDINLETNPQLMSLLPSTLTKLVIYPSFACEAWSLIPPHLTTLSFTPPDTMVSKVVDNDGISHEVKSFPFDVLPRSITCIMFAWCNERYFFGPPSTSHRSFFPPQLARLSIPDTQLSPEIAKLLPSSLGYLEFRNLCERVCEHIPRSLKTLISSGTLMSPNLIKFLPKSLTHLHLSASLAEDNWFDWNTGQIIDPISTLPEYSIHEKCLSRSYDWAGLPLLPPTLTYFKLADARDLGDSFIAHQRLPNLLELWLGDSKHFSDIHIPLLSRHLTTLELVNASTVSGKSFELLPKGLTHLCLVRSESIFDCDIQHLPRTLKHAFLSHAIHLTNLCIPDLPPRLEMLALGYNHLITPDCVSHLPYPLRSAQYYSPVTLATWRIIWGEIKPVSS